MSNFVPININKKKRITLRKLKNWFLGIFVLAVIFFAISFTLMRYVIRSVPDYSMAIQKMASEKMDVTLIVKRMDADIYWLVPRLNLFDVDVYDKTGKYDLVHLDKVDISLDWSETLKKLSPVIDEITLVGLNAQIGINKNSQLLVQQYVVNENINATFNGINNSKKSAFKISDEIKSNFNNLNFKIIKSRVLFYDDRYDKRTQISSNFDLRLKNNGTSHLFEVYASLPDRYGKNTHMVFKIDGDLFDYKKLKGSAYLSLGDINLGSWINDFWREMKISMDAKINGEVWLEWANKDIKEINSRIKISDLSVMHVDDEGEHQWLVDQLNAQTHWVGDKKDWQLDIRDLVIAQNNIKWLKPAAATLKMSETLQQVSLQADFLRLENLVYLGGMFNHVSDLKLQWIDMVEKYKPSGELKDINIQLPLDKPHNIKINTKFDQIGLILLDAEQTKIKNLKGSVAFIENKTWLTLNSKNIELEFKTLFREHMKISELKGDFQILHLNHVWEFSSEALKINTPHFESDMRLVLKVPDDGKIFLNLMAHAKNMKADSVSLYMPAGIMDKDVMEWIDMALNEGNLISGNYLFYGEIDDFPFRGNEGVSIADLDVTNLSVNYLDNWPIVRNISANIRFKNDTMLGKLQKGQVFDSKILNANVVIDSFVKPKLSINGQVDTQLKDLKRFVNESELRENATDYINNLKFKGKGLMDLEIKLPLYGKPTIKIKGKMVVNNGGLKFKKENHAFEKINGTIYFSDDMINASNIKAELFGNGLGNKLNINIQTKKYKKAPSYYVDVAGNIRASSLLTLVPNLKTYFKGSSIWKLGFDIPNKNTANAPLVKVKLSSDLKGVDITLPGPLYKVSDEIKSINIDVDVKTSDEIKFQMSLLNGDNLDVEKSRDNVVILANTESIKGRINFDLSKKNDMPIIVDLDYLDVNKSLNLVAKNKNQVDNKKIKKNISKTSSKISPLEFPSIDFYAKKIMYKNLIYKDGILVANKTKLGSIIKNFKLSEKNHTITGKGSWLFSKKNKSTTKLNMNIDISNMGEVLKNTEISDALLDTSGNIKLRWQWEGAPYDFDWKLLKGNGEIKLKNGTLKDLNAGAGRLLGLISFRTILSLDFGDQMKDGFKFDSAQGSFLFGNEKLTTDDLLIESKIADIEMNGSFDMVNNTVDQIVTVRPSVGETFSLGAAVIVSPTAGGLLYLFQKLLNTDKLSEYQYSMKGSFDEPVVKLISVPVTDQDEDDFDGY